MWRNLGGYVLLGFYCTARMTFCAPALEKVTVCDVLANPLKYNGKMILLEGDIVGTDEGGWLTASTCPAQFVTGEHVWPNSIFLQDPANKHNLHKVDFRYDYQAEKKFFTESDALEKRNPDRKLRWVYERSVRDKERTGSLLLATYPNGTAKYIGFGHLSEAPAQLIVKAIRGVSLAP